jgi:hypothetical protein
MMVICDFFSDIALLDRATHYRSQEGHKNDQSPPGPVSKIVRREPCSHCGRTIMLSTASGINATFTTRHQDCVTIILKDLPDDER